MIHHYLTYGEFLFQSISEDSLGMGINEHILKINPFQRCNDTDKISSVQRNVKPKLRILDRKTILSLKVSVVKHSLEI